MTRTQRTLTLAGLAASLVCSAATAGDVEIVSAKAGYQGPGLFRFEVTLKHADTGWDHYANRWRVLSTDGKTVYGTRKLLHPHVHEQPFTRALSNVRIPDGVTEVLISAQDSLHGVTKTGLRLSLTE